MIRTNSARPGAPIQMRPLTKVLSVLALIGLLATVAPLDVGASVSDGSLHSHEVRRLYLAYFDREPDPGGAAYWEARRNGGMSVAAISGHFSRSPEFVARYGAVSDAEFVSLVYRNVMQREPDAAGLAYWQARMAEGMSRGTLMAHFSESAEFKRSSGSPVAQPPGRPAAPGNSSGGGGGGSSTPSTTVAPTTTTVAPTTTTVAPTTTTVAPTTTTVPGSQDYSTVASNFRISDWLISPWEPNPADMSWEPSGAFRTFCSFSHVAFADPIVSPGNDRFAHLHMFFGNRSADHRSTYRSLRTNGDSTCDGGPLNRTAYWMPAVFDNQGRVVAPDYFELYYKGENTGGTLAQKQSQIRAVQPYPNGLRMIAGAPARGVWGWKCAGGRESSTIPDCPAGERLTAWVRFPYCWDGKNLDSPDHRSHMAYGTNNTWGPCPASHPVHLPELTEMAHFESPSGSSQWYLSSDRMNPSSPAPNGSTFHADWFGAWDNTIQDRWVQHCIRGMRSGSNGNLCDGQQLRPMPSYSGSKRITGWRPTP